MKNLQYLATELFKVKNYISPEIMNFFVFQENGTYNLRSDDRLGQKITRVTRY